MALALVVGGAGYVGSILVRSLLEEGWHVRLLDRLYYGGAGLLGIQKKAEIVVEDMRSAGREIFTGVDAVINVAGFSNDPTAEYNPSANYELNTVAAEKLARATRDAGVRRYILASTCSIYDGAAPAGETELSEDASVAPRATYARSKLEAERQVLALADDDFSPVALRKGTVYGFSPRMRYDLVVNTFVKDALTAGHLRVFHNGLVWRPLLHVEDAAQAYLACLAAPEERIRGKVFNAPGRNYLIRDLADEVQTGLAAKGVKTTVGLETGGPAPRSYRVAGDQLSNDTGFICKRNVTATVPKMLDYIREARCNDFCNPIYYNIRWMKLSEAVERRTRAAAAGRESEWSASGAAPQRSA